MGVLSLEPLSGMSGGGGMELGSNDSFEKYYNKDLDLDEGTNIASLYVY